MDDKEILEKVKEVWNSNDLNLHLPVIDIQHAWLIFLIVKLENSISENKINDEVFTYSLKEALRYTYQHFTLEEELLKEIKFPNLEDHIENHRKFVKHLRESVPMQPNSTAEDVQKFADYLKEWLFNHIIKKDALYRDFILQERIELPQFTKDINKIYDTRITKEHRNFYLELTAENKDESDLIEEDVINSVADIWERYRLPVYIPIVDMQHMWLVKILVELEKILRLNSEQERIELFNKTIQSALDYTREHFASEEMLMVNYNYPYYNSHLKQHKYFLDFIVRRNQEFKDGDFMAAGNLVGDLRDWLLTHIAVEDKRLRTFFKNQMDDVLKFTKSLIQSQKIVLRKGQVILYQQVMTKNQELKD